ncbi:MAG: hypothetical protein V7L27_32055 [Nostoc sp.]|uniref:hypothetical protein n=1 Tax=Nostoc sp. TaxID=1180 RepID=UPI002FFAE63E
MFSYQSGQKSKKTRNLIQQQQPQQQRQKTHPQAILQRAQMNPGSLSQGDILQLQRTIGNQAVGNLIEAKMGADGLTVQRKLSENETDEAKKARKITTQEAVNNASYRANPGGGKQREGAFSVEAIVFSDLKKDEIHSVAPMTNQSRKNLKEKGKLPDPKTDKALIRKNPENQILASQQNAKSKDGEMYLIDKLDVFFRGYFNKEKVDAMKKSEDTEHLRIELVGPRGTCEDCQAGLQKWLHNDLQGNANKAEIGQKVSFSLVTRYLPENKREEGGGSYTPDARKDASNMGSMYGHPDAKYKPEGIKAAKGQTEYDKEHDRLKYKSQPPQGVEGVTEASNQVKPSEVKHGEKIEGVTGASNQVKPSEVKQDDEGFTTVSHKRGKKK